MAKPSEALDRVVEGHWLWPTAFGLGLAEATVFFVIPDVFLAYVAVRSLRRSLLASLWMLAGALCGGAAMYLLGSYAPEAATGIVGHVPFVVPDMFPNVLRQLQAEGLLAVVLGPPRWIPYKVYAVVTGGLGLGLGRFLLVSVVARYYRFLATCLVPWAISRLLRRVWAHGPAGDDLWLTVYWIVQYAVYWSTVLLVPGRWR